MPGLTFSNELISRDESLHTEFAIHLFHMYKQREQSGDGGRGDINESLIVEMVREAVNLEKSFVFRSGSLQKKKNHYPFV
jgi:ribonucleotide reductase beta subunit family protein with ferritin-like domain